MNCKKILDDLESGVISVGQDLELVRRAADSELQAHERDWLDRELNGYEMSEDRKD